jgi:predicted alpha/beta hydrolase family esterase
MPTIEGPYKTLVTADGLFVPWYVVPFDKEGRCKAPRTRTRLLEALESGGYSHVFLFSHGWNNDWQAASERYEQFAAGFMALRKSAGLPVPANYRPLLVGVFWPSTSLVLPWESGPRFAGGDGARSNETKDVLADDIDRSIDALAEELPEAALQRFYELTSADRLDADDVRELAALLAPVLGADDELGTADDDAGDLAEAWLAGARLLAARSGTADTDEESDDFGTATPLGGSAAPEAAGWLDALDPRHALRMATVWKMKDRAGTVGANGVHPLLRDILRVSAASVHLVGHSYGCKVLLSAVAAGTLSRKVTSALLLQPAISHRAFAVDADGEGRPGGYRQSLERIAEPVLCTFSSHDFALATTFHLAVRRRSDLGEQRIAAGAPSRFAALGGYGPGGMRAGEHDTVAIKDPGQVYSELLRPGLEVLALEGSQRIKGHGDILQPATYWALHEQVRLARDFH